MSDHTAMKSYVKDAILKDPEAVRLCFVKPADADERDQILHRAMSWAYVFIRAGWKPPEKGDE
jgi:hypothetical protein